MPQPFTAVVGNASNTAVNWSVNGIPGGTAQLGTISSAGVYMAPATIPAGAITVTAISEADPAKVSNATITFVDQVTISLTPPSSTVTLPGTQQFTATVNVTNNAVTWAVNGFVGGSGVLGTVNDLGLYTAPDAIPAGLIEVTASLQADPSRRASAWVTLNFAPVSLTSISPPTAPETEWGATVSFTVEGSGFGPFTSISVFDFCGLPELVSHRTLVSSNRIEFDVRFPRAGDYTIQVANPPPGGTIASLPFRLTGVNSVVMTRPRTGYAAAQLHDGRVLIAGGLSCRTTITNTAEIFDPVAMTFTATADTMTSPRAGHTATLLEDGRVLITGGTAAQDLESNLATAEIYDPATDSFTATGVMSQPRTQHTATMLPDGKVMVIGGRRVILPSTIFRPFTAVAVAEIYDPISNGFSPLGSLNVPRFGHSATLLSDGRVFVAGGWGVTQVGSISEPFEIPQSEIFQAPNFALAAALASSRIGHTTTVMNGGMVFLAGGITGIGRLSHNLMSAERYDSQSGAFLPPLNMIRARLSHSITLLPSGRYFLVGGSGSSKDTELFDPVAGGFLLSPPTRSTHWGHTAVLLPDGRIILIAGGIDQVDGTDKSTQAAEIITPP